MYMPLQHSESLEDVTLAVKYFFELDQTAPQPQKERFISLHKGRVVNKVVGQID